MERTNANDPEADLTLTTVYTYENNRLVCETSFEGTEETATASGSRIYVYGDYYCYTPA